MDFKCHHLLCALQKVTDTDWESNQNNQDWNKDDLKFNTIITITTTIVRELWAHNREGTEYEE